MIVADCYHAMNRGAHMNDNSPTSPNLNALREQIDLLDAQLVELLNARAKIVIEIGKLKQQNNSPIYAPDRETLILQKLRELNHGPLPQRALEAIYRELMSGSFALERPLRIAFLGPAGSFSHSAAITKFGASVEYLPMDNISAVFDAVTREHADYGLAPVENSIHGGVIDTLDAFLASSAKICAEVNVAVHHNLLAKESWDKIERVYSKPEVFTQCRNWLAGIGKGREIQPVASTSAAAQLAANDPASAAIGSHLAAEIYGLHMLFERIEDRPDNITRFFVIAREPAKRIGDDKTAIMFITGHQPGALAEVLDVFKEAGINLTDIEKRPSRNQNWQYSFFIDAEGHQDDDAMRRAVDDARKHCLQLTVLGSYPRASAVR